MENGSTVVIIRALIYFYCGSTVWKARKEKKCTPNHADFE